jgi:hypothetical protein
MTFLRCTAVAALASFALPANAGTGSGLVREIIPVANGIVVFTIDTHSGRPVCDKFSNQFEFDASTADGKNKLAVLIAAANARNQISIIGTGACSGQGREAVLYFKVVY